MFITFSSIWTKILLEAKKDQISQNICQSTYVTLKGGNKAQKVKRCWNMLKAYKNKNFKHFINQILWSKAAKMLSVLIRRNQRFLNMSGFQAVCSKAEETRNYLLLFVHFGTRECRALGTIRRITWQTWSPCRIGSDRIHFPGVR